MKTKFQFFRWLMILMLSMSALGAWAQTSQTLTQTVCVGSQPYMVDKPLGIVGSTYTWAISGGGAIANGQGSNSINVNWTTPGGPYNLIVIRNDGSCDGPPQTVAVTVIALPTPLVSGTNPVCANRTYTYTTPASGNNFTWAVSANGTLNSAQGTNSMSVIWNSSGPGTVTVTENVSSAFGCSVTNTLNVTVNPLPTATISGPAPVCQG
ncbi:MAG: hypothetical protein WCL21_10915, partial [Mariniphaga sp.]